MVKINEEDVLCKDEECSFFIVLTLTYVSDVKTTLKKESKLYVPTHVGPRFQNLAYP